MCGHHAVLPMKSFCINTSHITSQLYCLFNPMDSVLMGVPK